MGGGRAEILGTHDRPEAEGAKHDTTDKREGN